MTTKPGKTLLIPDVPKSVEAALLRLAHRIDQGWSGEVSLQVSRNGGIMSVKWIETETGDMLKEWHGS